jgi:hypothetical protein
MEGQRFATIEEIKTASIQNYTKKKVLIRNALRIRKSAGTSVLYLRGITVNGAI